MCTCLKCRIGRRKIERAKMLSARRAGGTLSLNDEYPTHEQHAKALLAKMEEGRKAYQELHDRFGDKVGYVRDGHIKTISSYSRPRELQIKWVGDLSVIAPFRTRILVDSKAEPCGYKWLTYDCRVEGDTLHVGCQQFPLTELREMLERFMSEKPFDNEVINGNPVRAIRRGVRYGDSILTWANVYNLLKILKGGSRG